LKFILVIINFKNLTYLPAMQYAMLLLQQFMVNRAITILTMLKPACRDLGCAKIGKTASDITGWCMSG